MFVFRTYGGLKGNELVSIFNPNGLVPNGGFDPSLNFDSRLQDDFFCNPFGDEDKFVPDDFEYESVQWIENGLQNKLRVYPDPTSGQINVLFKELHTSNTEVDILIFDQIGQTIYSKRESINDEIQIELRERNNLSSGFYIMQVRHSGNDYYFKILLNK